MTRWVVMAVCIAVVESAGPRIAAQTVPDPTLHRRGATSPPEKPARAADLSAMPPDASGEYLLDEAGSVVEITLESGKLTGYVTRMGDEQSDEDTPLTLFFDQSTAHGNHVGFTTRKVHGVWYSFEGTIVRGDPKITKMEDGYLRLTGSLTTHDDARNTQSKEQVSLKSTPRAE